jgi:hypothetical protein
MTSLIVTHRNAVAASNAPVVAFQPEEVAVAGLPSLRAWWRADESYNPATVNGAWVDRVNSIPLTLRRSTWPVRTSGGIGGRDFLQFAQTAGTILQTPADAALWPLGPSPWTFAWIGEPSANNYGVNEAVFGNEQAGSGQFPSSVFYQGNDTNKPLWIRENNAAVTNTTGGFPPSGGPHLMIVSRNPGGGPSADRLRVYADGVEQSVLTPANAQNSNSRLLVGGNINAASTSVTNAGFGGRIYDIWAFNTVLTADERAVLSDYAAAIYGL